jgi:hypothetical protein
MAVLRRLRRSRLTPLDGKDMRAVLGRSLLLFLALLRPAARNGMPLVVSDGLDCLDAAPDPPTARVRPPAARSAFRSPFLAVPPADVAAAIHAVLADTRHGPPASAADAATTAPRNGSKPSDGSRRLAPASFAQGAAAGAPRSEEALRTTCTPPVDGRRRGTCLHAGRQVGLGAQTRPDRACGSMSRTTVPVCGVLPSEPPCRRSARRHRRPGTAGGTARRRPTSGRRSPCSGCRPVLCGRHERHAS